MVMLEQIQAQNRATIEAVWSVRDELRREFNQKFDEVNARLDVLTERVDALEKRVGALEVRVDASEKRGRSVELAVLDLDTVVRKNSADIEAMRLEFSHLARIVATKADADRLAGLETRVDQLEARTPH
jgi:BMFP domain-containing protein YqiC